MISFVDYEINKYWRYNIWHLYAKYVEKVRLPEIMSAIQTATQREYSDRIFKA